MLQNSTFKRWVFRLLHLLLLGAAFAAGMGVACRYLVFSNASHLDHLDDTRRKLCQEIYGENWFHHPGIDRDADAKLAKFDPAVGDNSLSLSWSSVWGESSLTLQGNGNLVHAGKDGTQILRRVDPEACKAMFHQVLASGLLNFSPGVLRLKQDLDDQLNPSTARVSIDDGATVTIRIKVPGLEVDKEISAYEPATLLEKSHPDIIELQKIVEIESAMRRLVPEGNPARGNF